MEVGEKNILINAGVRVNESGEASLSDLKMLKEIVVEKGHGVSPVGEFLESKSHLRSVIDVKK